MSKVRICDVCNEIFTDKKVRNSIYLVNNTGDQQEIDLCNKHFTEVCDFIKNLKTLNDKRKAVNTEDTNDEIIYTPPKAYRYSIVNSTGNAESCIVIEWKTDNKDQMCVVFKEYGDCVPTQIYLNRDDLSEIVNNFYDDELIDIKDIDEISIESCLRDFNDRMYEIVYNHPGWNFPHSLDEIKSYTENSNTLYKFYPLNNVVACLTPSSSVIGEDHYNFTVYRINERGMKVIKYGVLTYDENAKTLDDISKYEDVWKYIEKYISIVGINTSVTCDINAKEFYSLFIPEEQLETPVIVFSKIYTNKQPVSHYIDGVDDEKMQLNISLIKKELGSEGYRLASMPRILQPRSRLEQTLDLAIDEYLKTTNIINPRIIILKDASCNTDYTGKYKNNVCEIRCGKYDNDRVISYIKNNFKFGKVDKNGKILN